MNSTNTNCRQKQATLVKQVFFAMLFLVATIAGQAAQAQTANNKAVQTSAIFPGGMESFYTYIHSNIKPDSTCWPGRQIYVGFMVDKDGNVKHARIRSKMLSRKMTTQLIQVFQQAPKWIPAQQNGLKVREHFICPVTFSPPVEMVAQVK